MGRSVQVWMFRSKRNCAMAHHLLVSVTFGMVVFVGLSGIEGAGGRRLQTGARSEEVIERWPPFSG